MAPSDLISSYLCSYGILSWTVGRTTLLMPRLLQNRRDVTSRSRLQETVFCPASLFSLLPSPMLTLGKSTVLSCFIKTTLLYKDDPAGHIQPRNLQSSVQQVVKKWILPSTTSVSLEADPPSALASTLSAVLWEPANPTELHPEAWTTEIVSQSFVTKEKITSRVCRTLQSRGQQTFSLKG